MIDRKTIETRLTQVNTAIDNQNAMLNKLLGHAECLKWVLEEMDKEEAPAEEPQIHAV